MNESYSKHILKIFANNPFESFNHKQIASRVGAHNKVDRQLVLSTIQELAENGMLIPDTDSHGRYKLNPAKISDDLLPKNYVTGIIDMKQTGKAYVMPHEEGREDILIAPNNTGHALHGDTVMVMMFPQRKMRKPEGQVVEIIHRAKTRFVGILQVQDRFAFMVSDNRTMVVDIFIPLDALSGATDGEKVVVEMTDWPERMNNPVGRVIKRLGKPGDNNVEMQSILAEYDFPLDFPSEVEKEAEMIAPPTPDDYKGRKDFREVTTLTIDPADAKDFDDAISFRELKNGNYEIGVHIADVSHYVKPGSAIDREAYQRGTSVYLVDRTFPMLPERLCNEVCSLRPHEDKLCYSVVMEMNADARLVKSWIGPTVINSNTRYSYEEAQEVIDTLTTHEGREESDNAVMVLHKMATVLRDRRFVDGAINFDTKEVKFQLDENAKPIGVYIKEDKEANWLIEEFMLLANQCVARRIGEPKAPKGKEDGKPAAKTFVYRVHDEPNPEKLNTFVEFVAKLGYKLRVSSRQALAHSYNDLFESISGRGEEYMIDTIAVRTMAKAYYSTENIGHYGLGFAYYTHFTSPIRRYPDLMVHRLMKRYLHGGPSVSAEEYEEYCHHCSLTERHAAEAERASIKYKQAEYLADKIGQTFPAVVSGVSKWGLYAEIDGSKCEGMVPINSLKDDYYMLDEDNYQVIGRSHGKAYTLGMPITIRVHRVDMLKKRIDFELVDEEEEKPHYPTRKGRKSKAAPKPEKAKRSGKKKSKR